MCVIRARMRAAHPPISFVHRPLEHNEKQGDTMLYPHDIK